MLALQGQVTYRERVALPPGASLRIVLVDLTESGTPARVDVRAPIGSPGQVPLTFALNFDDRALVPGHQYGLVAEILAGDDIRFRSAAPMALDPRSPPAPIVVITSPAVDGDAPDADDEPSAGEIAGVTWRAAEIGGAPALAGVDSTLSLASDNRAGGRGGCNNYFAQAEITGARLSFGDIAATRMACVSEEATAQESAFFAALASARGWRLGDDGSLLLVDAGNEVVVRFEPVSR
jgi:putative lipoprotein